MTMGDRIKHEAEELKGKAKETVGDATGNERMEAEGKAEKDAANVKQAGDKAKDAAGDVKDAFKR